MKLRNKKTGEIIEFDAILPVKDIAGGSVAHLEYSSLAELNSEWEDAPEEPKEYWYIDYDGGILCRESDNSSAEKMMKSIGNYFESLEEAELAVRKLKAVNRLKDKGFRFDDYRQDFEGYWVIYPNDTEGTWSLAEDKDDLDLLFRR